MLTGLLIGIVPDRGLMHEAEVHIPIPWFIDYGLHARLPDHSSVTHIRPRRGEKRFQEISWRTVTTSQDAKITTARARYI